MNQAKLITIKEAASLLGVSALTLRNWDKNGKLIAFRHPLNNYRVYKRDDIDALIAKIGSNLDPVDTRRPRHAKKLAVQHLSE
jgi:DNA (cytosine-5)-methyltransferase 1